MLRVLKRLDMKFSGGISNDLDKFDIKYICKFTFFSLYFTPSIDKELKQDVKQELIYDSNFRISHG